MHLKLSNNIHFKILSSGLSCPPPNRPQQQPWCLYTVTRSLFLLNEVSLKSEGIIPSGETKDSGDEHDRGEGDDHTSVCRVALGCLWRRLPVAKPSELYRMRLAASLGTWLPAIPAAQEDTTWKEKHALGWDGSRGPTSLRGLFGTQSKSYSLLL